MPYKAVRKNPIRQAETNLILGFFNTRVIQFIKMLSHLKAQVLHDPYGVSPMFFERTSTPKFKFKNLITDQFCSRKTVPQNKEGPCCTGLTVYPSGYGIRCIYFVGNSWNGFTYMIRGGRSKPGELIFFLRSKKIFNPPPFSIGPHKRT